MDFDSLRNWLASVVKDLRSRRLLPVLILLIAAAVAVPLVLSKSGKPAALATLPPTTSVTVTAPSLGTATPSKPEPVQNYLTGPDHDPFKSPTTQTKSTASGSTRAKTTSSSTASSTQNSKGSGGKSTSSNSGTAGKTVTVTKTTSLPTCPAGLTPGVIGGKNYCLEVCRRGLVPVVRDGKPGCAAPASGTAPKTITPTFTEYAPDVTFGLSGHTGTVYHHLARYQLLPNDTAPAAEFLGVEASDRQTAVFWVSGAAKVTGGADCSPSATQCSFVQVKPGSAFYLDLPGQSGSQTVYRIQYDSVTKITSNGSYAFDATGRQLVDAYRSRLSTLDSLSYSAETGLMSITLGTSERTPTRDSESQVSTVATPAPSAG